MATSPEVTSSKAEILKRVPLFAALHEDGKALDALAKIMKWERREAGETLLQEGELGDQYFILLLGSVSVFRKTPEGDHFKVAILRGDNTPGLGEGGLIAEEPRSATIICDEECQLLKLTREAFGQFCEEHPRWALPILRTISVQLMARVRQTSNDLMLLHKALMMEIRG